MMDRLEYIGSSEIAALFEVHPWLTPWELWHIKRGDIEPRDLSDSEKVQMGIALEASIAEEAARKWNWKLRKGTFVPHPTIPKMGATPDYFIEAVEGDMVLEIKNVSSDQAVKWKDEPPLHYLLQLQHQLACTRCGRGVIVAMIGGWQLRKWEYGFHVKTVAAIEREVKAFWESIEEGREPPFEGTESEIKALNRMYEKMHTGKVVDLSSSNAFVAACSDYLRLKEEIDKLERELNVAKATILACMKEATQAHGSGFVAKISITPARPPRAAEPGEIIPGRAEVRRLSVKFNAANKEKVS